MTHWRLGCENPRSDLIEGRAALTISARALQRRSNFVEILTSCPPKSLTWTTLYHNNRWARYTLFHERHQPQDQPPAPRSPASRRARRLPDLPDQTTWLRSEGAGDGCLRGDRSA